jgi:hypothetical protein
MASRLINRPLDEKELKVLHDSYRKFMAHYDSVPGDAALLIATGESKPTGVLPQTELAALTMVANQLMNLDEVLVK